MFLLSYHGGSLSRPSYMFAFYVQLWYTPLLYKSFFLWQLLILKVRSEKLRAAVVCCNHGAACQCLHQKDRSGEAVATHDHHLPGASNENLWIG